MKRISITSATSAVLTIGLLATFISTFLVFKLDEERRDNEFEKAASLISDDIQTTINLHVASIQQSAATVGIMPSISLSQFSSFAKSVKYYPWSEAMRAISWIPIVPDESRYQFENSAKAEGLENFQITERNDDGQLIRSEQRAQYYPVFYIEPLEGNEPAVGFDLGSNQHRLDALSMSTATQASVATSPIELVQRQGSSLGFLIFSPVYVQNTGVLRGFISGVFDIDALVQNAVINNQSTGIEIALIDESHDPLIPIFIGAIKDGTFQELDSGESVSHESVSDIVLPNRVWKLAIDKKDGAFERSIWLWAFPVVGIIPTLAITLSVFSIERRKNTLALLLESKAETEKIDRIMAEDQARHTAEYSKANAELAAITDDWGRLIETANAPIFGVDINENINVWNRKISDITGFDVDDVIGKHFIETMISERHKQMVLEMMGTALGGEGKDVFEVPVKTKDGRILLIVMNSSSRRDSEGNITGAIGVGNDVTLSLKTERERNKLLDEKTELVRRLLQSQEEERGSISFDLHDGPAQYLAGASMFLESHIELKEKISEDESEKMIVTARGYVKSALQDVQRIMAGLRPSALDDLGFIPGLRESSREVARRTGRDVRFTTSLEDSLEIGTNSEIVLYRIAQEAVNNSVKHTHSGTIIVNLATVEEGAPPKPNASGIVPVNKSDIFLQLTIRDYGRGFDYERLINEPSQQRGMGLVGMRERSALIGAWIGCVSNNRGTTVTVKINLTS
ncbi:MAG: CHASE domain-containing protein [Chloroflexi bacterium]|nr:CHASE domain-containing protein [Chloroflexota bacterium]